MAEFIAEISSNHNGDLQRCFDLIRAAARCGCLGVKFQLFRINRLFAPEILQVSEKHRARRRWELPVHYLKDLASCCRDEGVRFGCTPFDLEAVDLLEPHTDFLKVSSYELPWTGLINHCASTGQPLMISTGMATAQECSRAVATAAAASCQDLTVFHCVSRYPVAAEDCNLAAIASLRELPDHPSFRVGWSDHSVQPGVVARAVKHWQAEVVEFHFDLDGQGEEFGGGHCWLPKTIGPVIADQVEMAGPECDGEGKLLPHQVEALERPWRADPSDGLRPTLPVRITWPQEIQEKEPTGPTVVFYASGLGLGHLSRCLALAEALRRYHGARVLFLIQGSAGQKDFLERHGFSWHQVADEIEVLAFDLEEFSCPGSGALLAVLDVLDLPDELIKAFKSQGFSVVVLDQPACEAADLVVVPSFGWQADTERKALVGGSEYLLVREDIVRLRGEKAATIGEQKILVSFGGQDPHRLTEKVIQALSQMVVKPAVQVVVGPELSPFETWTQKALEENRQIRIIQTGIALDVVLPGSDLVITALGLTVAEANVLGLPVAVLRNWEQDEEPVQRLVARQAVADLGFGPEADPSVLAVQLQDLWNDQALRQTLAVNGWCQVDGDGARRTAQRIVDFATQMGGRSC